MMRTISGEQNPPWQRPIIARVRHLICLLYTSLGLENTTVLGYVDGMAALMAASDLVICKSGGLTVTECLCAQVDVYKRQFYPCLFICL